MKRIITKKRAEEIFEQALDILEEIGLEYLDDTLIPKIQEKVPCVYEEQHIRFPRESMRAFFEMRRPALAKSGAHDEDNVTIGGNWNSWYLCDPVTNIPRKASYEEAIQMARLAEALGAASCPIPVAPENILPDLHTIECERIADRVKIYGGSKLALRTRAS